MFVAVKGVTTDGHKYIRWWQAPMWAIVCEEMPAKVEKGITYVRVADSAEALGRLASAGMAIRRASLKLVGVTGTNGKTPRQPSFMRWQNLKGTKPDCCQRSALCLRPRRPDHAHHSRPLTLNQLLAEMVEEGCEYALWKCRRIPRAQRRVAGLQIRRRHIHQPDTRPPRLSRHGGKLYEREEGFLRHAPTSAFALTNADDKCGMYMVQNTKAKVYTYSLRADADSRGKCWRHASTAH